MMRALPLAGLLLLAGCGAPGPAPNAFERQARLDRETARVRRSMNPCVIDEGGVIRSRRYRDCLDLLPQERMRGVWYTGFEENSFVPNATGVPARRIISRASVEAEARSYVELEVPPVEADRAVANFGPEPGTRAVLISFLGRRERPRRFANGTAGGHVIVVDRLLSARVLGTTEVFLDCRDFPGRDPREMPCAPGTEGAGAR